MMVPSRSNLTSAILLLLLVGSLAGCAGLMPAQPPDRDIPATHLFGVTRISFDPTGERIASAGFQGDVAVWEVPGGRNLGRFRWHTKAVRGLAWADTNHLITAGEAGRVVVSDLASGSVQAALSGEPGITALVYLDRKKRVVVGYRDGRVIGFSYPELTLLQQIDLGAAVTALAVDQAGEQIAVSVEGSRVLLVDSALSRIRDLPQPGRDVLELRFSPDGRYLAAGAWYQVYYWDLKTHRLRVQDTEHWGAVTSLDFHPEGDRLVTLGRHTDANLRLVTVDKGDVLRRLQPHRLCGAAVRFSPDGRYVASGSDDESIRFYDLHKPYRPQRVGENW